MLVFSGSIQRFFFQEYYWAIFQKNFPQNLYQLYLAAINCRTSTYPFTAKALESWAARGRKIIEPANHRKGADIGAINAKLSYIFFLPLILVWQPVVARARSLVRLYFAFGFWTYTSAIKSRMLIYSGSKLWCIMRRGAFRHGKNNRDRDKKKDHPRFMPT